MISREDFFTVADAVVVANGRDALSIRGEVAASIEVRDADCVLQILAGPGSGKTEVLVWRILYELFVIGTDSSRLIVTTFTKKAASELQVRLADRVDSFVLIARERNIAATDPRIHNLKIGTLHSLCEQLLTELDPEFRAQGLTLMDDHEHRARMGFRGDFVTGRTGGALSRLSQDQLLTGLFAPHWRAGNWPSNRFDRLAFAMDVYAHLTETYFPRCAAQGRHGLSSDQNTLDQDCRDLHQSWHDHLQGKNVIDFAGIQSRLFASRQILMGRFSHVFVDEFQDTNPIQFLIHLGWLADQATKLTVVGDDDQAIYRFRGSDSVCFRTLQAESEALERPFRLERLTVNHRSSQNITKFTQDFRMRSAIAQVSLEKTVSSPLDVPEGSVVRIVRGSMDALAALAATEIATLGYGGGEPLTSTAAILCYSTSEKDGKPAQALRSALEPGIRVYNPRAKTAATRGSALSDLLGILSYLIDPITLAPVGNNGRNVEVWALHDVHATSAITNPPPFRENDDHIAFQKWFRKPTSRGSITATEPAKQEVLNYVDEIKTLLLNAGRANTRLTLAGLVARILAFPYFRPAGFTVQLLRQALFTQLLEAFVLPTRQTMSPLDVPLEVAMENGKWVWGDRYWRFLGVFASVLKNVPIDDSESEAFEEGAVPLITFHQAKGLEFDHVYVVGGGRELEVRSVLKNRLFSGVQVPTYLDAGMTSTDDAEVLLEAQADVDRELYVALSRAKESLTVLSPIDGDDVPAYAREHPVITAIIGHRAILHPNPPPGLTIHQVRYE